MTFLICILAAAATGAGFFGGSWLTGRMHMKDATTALVMSVLCGIAAGGLTFFLAGALAAPL